MTPTRTARAGLLAAFLPLAALAAIPAAASAKRGDVKVMTRNISLGSGLGGATSANSVPKLVDAAGEILRNVQANDFPTRAKGLAAEIRAKKPHLVGLQEVALWRTGPCTANPLDKTASAVLYDYLDLLVDELNKGKKRYRIVKSQDEFDFEIWVDQDDNPSTSAPGCPFGSELNGRLTMRDAIIAKRGVRTRKARGGNFDTLLQIRPGGVPIDVTRGWTSVNAKVKGARRFRFVNTHLEAFDNQPNNNPTNKGTEVGNGEVRLAQAQELIADGGPARGKRVILLGDLNSDDDTWIRQGDQLAHNWLLGNGFLERSTNDPLSCCLVSDLLAADAGGSLDDFDHQVDHVMTNRRKIKLRSSSVTGLQPVNGFWSADHAGVFSKLRVR